MKRLSLVILTLLVVIMLAGCGDSRSNAVIGVIEEGKVTYKIPKVKVHYIDVGQADAILIQLSNGQNILIDAGNNTDEDLVVNYLKQQQVSKLDHVIGTHPHEDHVGGLDTVIQNFKVGKVYLPQVSHTTKTYNDVLTAIQNKGLKITPAKAGAKLDVGQNVNAIFVAPNSTEYEDMNNYSAVLKLTSGDTSFLFTGDAETVSESEILRAGYDIKSDVLKVGHHGSHSSTSTQFLKAVSPKYAVISVGKDNDYGHPHAETLSTLAAAKVQIFRIDQQGTIVATSDGKNITFDKTSAVQDQAPSTPTPSTPSNVEVGKGVEIIDINLSTEVVTIKNNGNSEVNLAGWKLISEKGNQTFNFPEKVLAVGEIVKVISGSKAQAAPDTLVWTKKNIWNNDGDPGTLHDAGGNSISKYPR